MSNRFSYPCLLVSKTGTIILGIRDCDQGLRAEVIQSKSEKHQVGEIYNDFNEYDFELFDGTIDK